MQSLAFSTESATINNWLHSPSRNCTLPKNIFPTNWVEISAAYIQLPLDSGLIEKKVIQMRTQIEAEQTKAVDPQSIVNEFFRSSVANRYAHMSKTTISDSEPCLHTTNCIDYISPFKALLNYLCLCSQSPNCSTFSIAGDTKAKRTGILVRCVSLLGSLIKLMLNYRFISANYNCQPEKQIHN